MGKSLLAFAVLTQAFGARALPGEAQKMRSDIFNGVYTSVAELDEMERVLAKEPLKSEDEIGCPNFDAQVDEKSKKLIAELEASIRRPENQNVQNYLDLGYLYGLRAQCKHDFSAVDKGIEMMRKVLEKEPGNEQALAHISKTIFGAHLKAMKSNRILAALARKKSRSFFEEFKARFEGYVRSSSDQGDEFLKESIRSIYAFMSQNQTQ